MSDNSAIPSGDTIATDDLATINGGPVSAPVKVQRVKAGYGVDGDFRDVDGFLNGLPIAPTQAAANAGGIPVYDDRLNQLIEGTGSDGDQRSLLDVLDPTSPNYVTPPVAPAGIETTGQQSAAQSFPVVLATELTDAQSLGFAQSGAIPINTVLLAVDCTKIRSASIHVTSTGAGGALNIQWSNDRSVWVTLNAVSTSTGIPGTSLASGTIWNTPVFAKYFRIVAAGAFSSGLTAAAISGFREVVGYPIGTSVTQTTAANLNATVSATNLSTNLNQIGGNQTVAFPQTLGPSGALASLGVAAGGASNAPTEVASSARTTTGNSGTINDIGGGAISAVIAVTAAGGTNPTLDVELQESYDGGTTWQGVYHCERLTANGTLVVPPIQVYGRRRWAWTITGISPTFTFSISVSRGGFGSQPVFRQFFDRSTDILAGNLNGVSSTYSIAGCKFVTASIRIGAATTGGIYKLQGSADGTNWYDISGTVQAVSGGTVQVTSSSQVVSRFCRLLCSTAANGQAGVVASITASE